MEKKLPWQVPVPVKTSKFKSLYAKHAKFNVQTDLSQISPFGLVSKRDLKTMVFAHADLQTNADVNVIGRMGSGRSAFFAGAYLKGIGRTTLAANWNNPSDAYHNTGHLMASAAVREFVVTCWLDACGAKDLIVPCEGLLFKPVEKSLKNFFADIPHPGAPVENPVVDSYLQAISVKPGDFCRYSNVHWLLNQVNENTIDSFFELLDRYLPGSGKSAESIAVRFEKSIRIGFSNFFRFLECGVHWGSLDNNFTLDGRFLDLEVPILTAEPGLYFKTLPEEFAPRPMFYEPFGYCRQIRGTLNLMISQLNHILSLEDSTSQTRVSKSNRARTKLFLETLNRLVGPSHPARSQTAFSKIYVNTMSLMLELSGPKKRLLADLTKSVFEPEFETPLPLTLEPISTKFAKPEPALNFGLWEVLELKGRRARNLEASRALNEIVIELDQVTQIPELMTKLKRVPRQLESVYKKRTR